MIHLQLGTNNEVDVAVSATDTLTIGLPNDVTIGNDLTVTGDVGGATATTQVQLQQVLLMMVRQHMMLVLLQVVLRLLFAGAVQGGLTDGTMTISSGDIAAARDVQ